MSSDTQFWLAWIGLVVAMFLIAYILADPGDKE